jgi:hypothetical protein
MELCVMCWRIPYPVMRRGTDVVARSVGFVSMHVVRVLVCVLDVHACIIHMFPWGQWEGLPWMYFADFLQDKQWLVGVYV